MPKKKNGYKKSTRQAQATTTTTAGEKDTGGSKNIVLDCDEVGNWRLNCVCQPRKCVTLILMAVGLIGVASQLLYEKSLLSTSTSTSKPMQASTIIIANTSTSTSTSTPVPVSTTIIDNGTNSNNSTNDAFSRFPPTVQMCNVMDLSFNASLPMGAFTVPLIAVNGTKYAYGPFLRKCGSSTLKLVFDYITNNAKRYYDKNAVLRQIQHGDFHFLSILRHPLDRALAGHHQHEIFVRNGWTNAAIDNLGLAWWNKTCLATNYGNGNGRKCQGSPPQNTQEAKLMNLYNFWEEVSRVGFYDEHFMPLTYMMQQQPEVHKQAHYFDLGDLSMIEEALEESAGKLPHQMVGGGTNRVNKSAEIVWDFHWKELTSLASDEENELAGRIVQLLCTLFRQDVECLSYDIPECTSLYHAAVF